jgi:hypothetical protein
MLLVLFVPIQFSIREVVFGFGRSRIALVLERDAVEIAFHFVEFVAPATGNAVACLSRLRVIIKCCSFGRVARNLSKQPVPCTVSSNR